MSTNSAELPRPLPDHPNLRHLKMIDNGSDVHQGGDGPLMRAALLGHRIPMMEFLVSRGANVNALWNGYFSDHLRSM